MKFINQIKNKLNSNKFGKNIALITGGTAVAQILTALMSPIITRIYPPEEYGVLSTFVALINILTISSSLDYQNAIPIAEDDDEAINLLSLSTSILFLFTAIIAVLLSFNGDWFLGLLSSSTLVKYKELIPIAMLLTGFYQIIYQFALRKRNYKILTKTKIIQSIFSNVTKIIGGLIKIGPIGLIIGQIIGSSSGISVIGKPLYKDKAFQRYTSIEKMKQSLIKYYRFPVFSAPNNFVAMFVNQIPTLMLSSLYGSGITGLYGLANSITHIPMSLVGTSVSQVFYSEAAYHGKENPSFIKNSAKKIMIQIALWGLPVLLIYFIIAPHLFDFIFGNEWRIAGEFSIFLMIKVYFGLILSPVNRILEIYNRQKDGLIFNVIRLGLTLCVFYLANIFNFQSVLTIALFAVVNSVVYIIMIIWIFYILNRLISMKS